MTPDEIYAAINAERDRQREMWTRSHEWGVGDCSSQFVPEPVRAMVLSEETGEVCRAVLEQGRDELRTELVQVAAVAVAWLESL